MDGLARLELRKAKQGSKSSRRFHEMHVGVLRCVRTEDRPLQSSPMSKRHNGPVRLSRNAVRHLDLAFAGIWREWHGDRRAKKEPNVGLHRLGAFLTTEPNRVVSSWSTPTGRAHRT